MKYREILFLLVLLTISINTIPSQQYYPDGTVPEENKEPETSNMPQWAKDLRRWEIITFGTFPFTMFFATFGVDMYRYSKTGFEDRRYAPWPAKSAGAIAMNKREVEVTIAIAAGVSIALGIIDMIVVQVKRAKERKKAEAIPVGTVEITTEPYLEEISDTSEGVYEEEIREEESELIDDTENLP